MPMNMALVATLTTAVMVAIAATLAMEATVAMVPNLVAGMVVLMFRMSKHELHLLVMAMAMGSMVEVSRAVDFLAMGLDSQQMAKLVMMLIRRRIDQPPNLVVVDLVQDHVRTVYCVP